MKFKEYYKQIIEEAKTLPDKLVDEAIHELTRKSISGLDTTAGVEKAQYYLDVDEPKALVVKKYKGVPIKDFLLNLKNVYKENGLDPETYWGLSVVYLNNNDWINMHHWEEFHDIMKKAFKKVNKGFIKTVPSKQGRQKWGLWGGKLPYPPKKRR